MKPILIHCHIYYPKLWCELKRCILNVHPHPFDLYVTMVEKYTEIQKDIRKAFPNAHIEIVENRGYDIGPFMHILNQVNLDEYSYIIKLHTKRDLEINAFRELNNGKWRECLLHPFKSKTALKSCLKHFNQFPKTGMIADYHCIVHKDYYDAQAQKNFKLYLKTHHLPTIRYAFVGGTMFIARASLLKPIQKSNFKLSDFEKPDATHSKSTLAHMVERFLGYIVYYQGYSIQDALVSQSIQKSFDKKLLIDHYIQTIIRFFYQVKKTKSEHCIIKICKIPVYRRKLCQK